MIVQRGSIERATHVFPTVNTENPQSPKRLIGIARIAFLATSLLDQTNPQV